MTDTTRGNLRAFLNTTKVKGDARPTFEGHLALPGTEAERPFALWVRQTKTGGVMLTGKSGQPKGSAIEQIVGLLGSKGSRTPDLTVGESKLTLKPGELVLFENKPKEPNEKSPSSGRTGEGTSSGLLWLAAHGRARPWAAGCGGLGKNRRQWSRLSDR